MITLLKKYIGFIVLAVAIQGIMPGSQALEVSNDPEIWSATTAHHVNRHFRNEYKDDRLVFKVKPGQSKNIIKREINGKLYQVNRKRHGLPHGMRQGFLAVDIATALKGMPFDHFSSQKGKDFRDWIVNKVDHDPLFLQKLEMTAAFQRTGRESEAGFDDYPELYKNYERSDARNFETYAKKFIGRNSLFKNEFEMSVYKESLLHKTANEGKVNVKKNEDLQYLRDLLQITHMLDLRRVPSFSPAMIQDVVFSILFGKPVGSAYREKNFVQNLWIRTGEYLAATGDRDSALNKSNFSDRFFVLSNQPGRLAQALHSARKGSSVVF